MAKTLQFRRGTTAELSSVTGAVGELFVDTTKDTVVVMDGSTAGGKPLATEAYVGTAISNLVDAAPGALDTLNELAAALNDDASFSTTVTNGIATAGGYANSAYSKANTAQIHAEAAFAAANTGGGGGASTGDFTFSANTISLPADTNAVINVTDQVSNTSFTFTFETDGTFVANNAIIGDVLITNDILTPIAYDSYGELDTGTLTVNGNLDVIGNLSLTGSVTGDFLVDGTLISKKSIETYIDFPNLTTYNSNMKNIDFEASSIVYLDNSSSQTSAYNGFNFINLPRSDDKLFSITVIINQSSTAWIPSNIYAENNNISDLNWSGGAAPEGTADGIDVLSFTFIYTGMQTPMMGGSPYPVYKVIASSASYNNV